MNLDEIKIHIGEGLTGDEEYDIIYLQRKAEEFAASEYGYEVAVFCARLVQGIRPEIDPGSMPDPHGLKIAAALSEAAMHLATRRVANAKRTLVDAIERFEAAHLYSDDRQVEYKSFDNAAEHAIYQARNGGKRAVFQVPEPLGQLYYIHGVTLLELGELERARLSLREAMRWNPVSPEFAFEYAEIFKRESRLDEFLKVTMGIFKNAYRPDQLSRCYRNIGYVLVERERWQDALSCYRASESYTPENEMTASEIAYILEKAGDVREPTDADLRSAADLYGFPIGPDRELVTILIACGIKAIEQNADDIAEYFITITYMLTLDDKLKTLLKNRGKKKKRGAKK